MCVFAQDKNLSSVLNSCYRSGGEERWSAREIADWGRTDAEPHAALPGSAPDMQSIISPVTKAILVALFIFAILLILYVILWYICRDVDCDHGIWGFQTGITGISQWGAHKSPQSPGSSRKSAVFIVSYFSSCVFTRLSVNACARVCVRACVCVHARFPTVRNVKCARQVMTEARPFRHPVSQNHEWAEPHISLTAGSCTVLLL